MFQCRRQGRRLNPSLLLPEATPRDPSLDTPIFPWRFESPHLSVSEAWDEIIRPSATRPCEVHLHLGFADCGYDEPVPRQEPKGSCVPSAWDDDWGIDGLFDC